MPVQGTADFVAMNQKSVRYVPYIVSILNSDGVDKTSCSGREGHGYVVFCLPEQAVGYSFPLDLGLVVEDKPTEFSYSAI
jgi:hypothetical protein